MRAKRLWAALLTAALLASLAVLPAAAAPGSFSDVDDPVTAVNADILRLMGVVSGTGDNRFDPGGTLSRAQFCTMAIEFLQRGDEAQRYATRTIFSDVKSTHWARGYVNLAATLAVGEEGLPLVSGVGDGRFLPDSDITLAEAVTILIRVLGYSGQQAGAVWPQGYLDLAASIGLTSGISAASGAAISRAQAAQLFVNALTCRTGGGEVYYETLGSASEKAIILEVDAMTDDGTARGAVRTVIGSEVKAYLPARGDGNPVSLQGRRGELVLNARDEIVTFLPDNSTELSATLDGDAKSNSFKDGDGKQYTISKDTPVYVADTEEDSGYKASQSYEAAYESLISGTRVTMYAENGRVAVIFASIPGTNISTDAVVVRGNASAAAFHQLTGGRTDFTLRRGKESVTLASLQDYDVVTYDKTTNTLLVSDLRLSCVYGEASPSPTNPETVTVLGNEFEVLESAWTTTNSFKPGDSVVLLLTADGKVAGMERPSTQVRSTAAVMNGSELVMFLPDGGTRTLSGSVSTSSAEGRLVILSGSKNNWTAASLPGTRIPGDYQVSAALLGTLPVASDVRIYEQTGASAMSPVDVKELTAGTIAASKIAAYRQNSSGIVDFIVLESVTGSAYEYGMMVSEGTTYEVEVPVRDKDGNIIYEKDENGNPTTTPQTQTETRTSQTWKLVRGSEAIDFASTTGYAGRSGDMIGVVTGKTANGSGENTIKAIVQLTEVKDVSPSDFFESEGGQYVTTGGRTYRVAGDVECCRSGGGNRVSDITWLSQATGAERLSAIKAYSSDLTIYVDPVGQQVRVIKAN